MKPERNLEAAKLLTEKQSEPPALTGSSHGTAVCGPACTVVWEGRSREASPYPDWKYASKKTGNTVPNLVRIPAKAALD